VVYKTCQPIACAELTGAAMRALVKESRALRERADAISLAVASVDAESIDLSTTITATRERLRKSWERLQADCRR